MIYRMLFAAVLLLGVAAQGCKTQHEVEIKPVEVKPIHITIDVNVRVDRALDDFFGDIDAKRETGTAPGTPSPQQ